jgi:hypothetical protein
LTELSAPAVEAFYAEEIGVGHALLLAKLQPAQQEQALANCFARSGAEQEPRGNIAPTPLAGDDELLPSLHHESHDSTRIGEC